MAMKVAHSLFVLWLLRCALAQTGGQQCADADSTCEDLEENSLLQTARRSGTQCPCSGFDCCCQTKCGQVGTSYVHYDVFTGSFEGEIEDNGFGDEVVYDKDAASTCISEITPLFKPLPPPNAPFLEEGKICCLYTGPTGFAWATSGVCNVLEKVRPVVELLGQPAAPDKPHPVKKCVAKGVTAFPTMFWETLSQQYAYYLNHSPGCHQQIFVLIPQISTISASAFAKKISIRVELGALNKYANVNFVTDDACETLKKVICGSYHTQEVLKDKKKYCFQVTGGAALEKIHPASFSYEKADFAEKKMEIECSIIDIF